jgi:hypothetical protein
MKGCASKGALPLPWSILAAVRRSLRLGDVKHQKFILASLEVGNPRPRCRQVQFLLRPRAVLPRWCLEC